MAQAIELLEQAIRVAPHQPQAYLELGTLFQQINEHEAALACYRDGLQADPDDIRLRQNLGFLLSHLGEPEEALEHYRHALHVDPSPITQVLAATVLPAICESVDQIDFWRNRMAQSLQQLRQASLRISTLRSQVPNPFYLAYHGQNDRALMELLGQIYEGPELCQPAGEAPLRPRDGRLRIGFLSSFFHDHTIGRLNLGLIEQLDRDRFEVTVFSVAPPGDAFSDAFRRAADSFVRLPREVDLSRTLIAETQLDVLVFADVGMDSCTSTLAYSRMTPVQCATWGHPITTGSPAIDYFVSSELIETAEADEHYSERLVRLPYMGVFYTRPQLTPSSAHKTSRQRLGLPADRHLYACPQTLFKFHPDFDAVLAGILEADPDGEIVLLEGRVSNWADRLRRRFERTIPHVERIRFLPSLPHADYLSFLGAVDVILDPLHFGGGNSSYEAMAVGTPVVTLPSQFLRGRITAALYKKMGISIPVVSSTQQYIETAVRLACDIHLKQEVQDQIRIRSDVLFEDWREVDGWERFLWSLTESRRLFVGGTTT